MTDLGRVFCHWLRGLANGWRPIAFLRIFCLPLLLAVVPQAQAATVTFTSSGTWTAPAGITSVDVEVWGGGGAGGGQNQNSDGGGGGGGGAYSKKLNITVVPGNSYTVSVGAGGAGVTSGTGNTGGDSYFINAATVMAKGGAGGRPSTGAPPAGGLGGAAATGVGDVKYSGGDGGRGRNDNNGRGGPGGSSAGTGANGTDGPDPYSTMTAAAAPAGGGIGGDGGSAGNDGEPPASGYGGGGGGSGDGSSMIGGAGAGGQVLITYVVPFICAPPANAPAGLALTCVCDSFTRATLNPSTIFGGNWSVSNSDGLGNPYINATTGLLRLTEITGYNAKAATVPSIFPAAGNYISAEFMHYAYQGGNTGADGIAVTLSDYLVPAVPGGFGGSLGYAQRTDGAAPPGFAGGWLGVALDEYGNYQNPTEGRRNGLVTGSFIPQSVGVRGPGNGANGYRLMGGTGGNPGGYSISANSTSSTPAPGYMYQVVVDARNFATGTVDVSVNRDATTKDGSTYTALFGPFNAYPEASYAQSQGWITKLVPDYWKISFTGSTGGSVNIHEIGRLRICAQTVYPDTGGTASGFSAIDEAYPGAPSVPAYPNFQTGNIYMKLAGTPFKLWVAALTGSGISSGYSATSNKYVQVKFVDNADNACGTDAARTCNATCTGKTAVEAGATQVATFVSGSSTGVASPSPTFTLNSAYRNLIAVMKECTTSTCAAFTATTPACSADSFSVRPLSIASVTSSNATNAATSGTPIFKADSDNFSLTATTTGVAGSPSKYTGSVTINNALVQPVSPATVAGIVSGVFPAATSGTPSSTATGTTFTYSEVGAFSLPGYTPATGATPDTTARSVYDDTWTAIDSISTKGDCLANSYSNGKVGGKYGCNFGLLPNAAVFGRFIPYEFRVVQTVIASVPPVTLPFLTNRPAAACASTSPFSYLDEGIGLAYTLEARSATGNITKNYAGTLAKLTLPADGSTMNFAAAVIGPPFVPVASNRIVGSVFAGAWPAMGAVSAGQVPVAGTVTVSSLTLPATNRVSPDGPFTNAAIGIAPVDSDGVRIMVYDLDSDNSGGVGATDHLTLATTSLYFGEIRLLPAIGSERLPLTMSAEVLRWNGAGFVPNGEDSCTQIPAARLALSGWTKNLGPGETTLPATALTFATGRGALRLSAPGAGNDGTVLLTADLATAGLGYLAGRWGGAIRYIQNPSAIAAFGLYKGAGPIVHFQENFGAGL